MNMTKQQIRAKPLQNIYQEEAFRVIPLNADQLNRQSTLPLLSSETLKCTDMNEKPTRITKWISKTAKMIKQKFNIKKRVFPFI
jgi:hypothetical protein